MRILLLGTGTPKPSLKRMGAGCLVEVGTDVVSRPGRVCFTASWRPASRLRASATSF